MFTEGISVVIWPTLSEGDVVGGLVSQLIQEHEKECFDDLATVNNQSSCSTVALIVMYEASPFC